MRYAQAEGLLHELRGHILLRSRLYQSKKRFSQGQRKNTRSRSLIDDVEEKVKASAAKYRAVWNCLEALSKSVLDFNWKKFLRPLADSDIKSMTSFDEGDVGKRRGLGEGRKKLAWIWMVQGSGLEVDAPTQAGAQSKSFLCKKHNNTDIFL